MLPSQVSFAGVGLKPKFCTTIVQLMGGSQGKYRDIARELLEDKYLTYAVIVK